MTFLTAVGYRKCALFVTVTNSKLCDPETFSTMIWKEWLGTLKSLAATFCSWDSIFLSGEAGPAADVSGLCKFFTWTNGIFFFFFFKDFIYLFFLLIN